MPMESRSAKPDMFRTLDEPNILLNLHHLNRRDPTHSCLLLHVPLCSLSHFFQSSASSSNPTFLSRFLFTFHLPSSVFPAGRPSPVCSSSGLVVVVSAHRTCRRPSALRLVWSSSSSLLVVLVVVFSSSEATVSGFRNAAIAGAVAAGPVIIGCRVIPWAKANLNYTAQALLISSGCLFAEDSTKFIPMDIISQLQEQVNTIASLSFNTFGTLQRDAPPVRLSPNYPEPATNPTEEPPNVTEQTKLMSTALVQAAKKFDLLVAALPLSDGGEEAQLKRIAELEAENEAVGQELQKQLEAAEEELRQVQDLFNQAADNCLNLKKPD